MPSFEFRGALVAPNGNVIETPDLDPATTAFVRRLHTIHVVREGNGGVTMFAQNRPSRTDPRALRLFIQPVAGWLEPRHVGPFLHQVSARFDEIMLTRAEEDLSNLPESPYWACFWNPNPQVAGEHEPPQLREVDLNLASLPA